MAKLYAIQQDLEEFVPRLPRRPKGNFQQQNTKPKVRENHHCNIVNGSITNMLKVIFNVQNHISHQYYMKIVQEIDRISVLPSYFRLKEIGGFSPKVDMILASTKPFCIDSKTTVDHELKTIADSYPNTILFNEIVGNIDVPAIEKFDFLQGSWMKCSKNHIYHVNETKPDDLSFSDYECIQCYKDESGRQQMMGYKSNY